MLKCIRSFSLNDFSFSLAYEAMPYIQSTPSIILDSSIRLQLSLRNPSFLTVSSFILVPCLMSKLERFTRHFLGHGLPPFNRFLKFLRKQRQIDVCNMSPSPFQSHHWESQEKLLVQLYDQVLFVFTIFLRSSQTFLLNEGLNRVKQFGHKARGVRCTIKITNSKAGYRRKNRIVTASRKLYLACLERLQYVCFQFSSNATRF